MKRAGVLALVVFLAAPFAHSIDLQDFAHGETLDYDLTWLRLTGGRMRMTISASGDKWRITSIAASSASFKRIYTVRDQIESHLTRDFSTVEYHKLLNENGKKKDDLTTIDTDHRLAIRVKKGKSTRTFRIVPPPPYVDPLSIVYKLRTLDLTPGGKHRFTLYADGNVYEIEATVGKRESITVPAGTYSVVSVEPKMNGRGGLFGDEDSRLIIWFSDNPLHVPVRIRSEVNFGSITASLRSRTAGVTSIEPGISK